MSIVISKEILVAELIRIKGEMDALVDSPSYTFNAWFAKQQEYINAQADLASYYWYEAKKEL